MESFYIKWLYFTIEDNRLFISIVKFTLLYFIYNITFLIDFILITLLHIKIPISSAKVKCMDFIWKNYPNPPVV